MDLNYLFRRQQVERSRAEAAASEKAREAHEELARQYELQIEYLTGPEFGFPDSLPRQARSAISLTRDPSIGGPPSLSHGSGTD